MVLVGVALRRLAFDAAVKIGKLLAMFFVGVLLMLSGCTVVTGGATVVTLFGLNTVAGSASVRGVSGVAGFDPAIPTVQLRGGFVSNVDRYILATEAGWIGENAITTVAISIAEDPSGDPAAEHVNDDATAKCGERSIDLGLLQINSGHCPIGVAWAPWGGHDALTDPAVNFWAGHTMWETRGFQPWTTYTTGKYLSNMAQARAAANAVESNKGANVFPLPGWTGQVNLHWGVAPGGSDLFAVRGWPVVSVSAGKVLESGFDRVGGNAVLILGTDGLQYYYAHFDDTPSVARNQTVSPGTLIGHVGNTGDADRGPTHLHIGIGHTILLGADAFGGTGSGFDAVSLLRQLYTQMHSGG